MNVKRIPTENHDEHSKILEMQNKQHTSKSYVDQIIMNLKNLKGNKLLKKQASEKYSGGEDEYDDEEEESKDNLSIAGKSRYDEVNDSNISYMKRNSMNFIPMNLSINHSTLDVHKKARNVWNPYKKEEFGIDPNNASRIKDPKDDQNQSLKEDENNISSEKSHDSFNQSYIIQTGQKRLDTSNDLIDVFYDLRKNLLKTDSYFEKTQAHIKIYTPKVIKKSKGHEITDEKINPFKNELFDELTNNKASDAEDKEIEIDENNEVNVNQIMRMKKNKFQQLWEINEYFTKSVNKSYDKLEEAKDQLDVAVRDYNYKMNTIQAKINDIAEVVFKKI